MCGIAGFSLTGLSLDQARIRHVLTRMGGALSHRGPDGHGVYVDPHAGIGLVHTRLSIQDLSEYGAQPMQSASGRYVITFNGEVYNFLELRKRLIQSGVKFRGASDTEVVINAIEIWGLAEALEKFVGMFAFALVDLFERRLFLVRDRIGEKPLYYGFLGKSFVFGSDLHPISLHPNFKATVDQTSLDLYLRHNYVPGSRSIFQGLNKMKPGGVLDLDLVNGSTHAWEFWDGTKEYLAPTEEKGMDEQEFANSLESLIRTSIENQMLSDVPIGAFLSGGIDSSLVVALMTRLSQSRVKTFSLGFQDPAFDESAFARDVAVHLGTDHTELIVGERDVLDVIPTLAEIYAEPFADSSQIPSFLLARLSRQSVTVALTGDGGDELFGGYDRYRHVLDGWSARSRLRAWAGRAAVARPPGIDSVGAIIPAFGWRADRKAGLWTAKSIEEYYLRHNEFWRNSPLIGLQNSDGESSIGLNSMRGPDCQSMRPLMYLDFNCYLPDDILVKVDRAAMANSLETRVPLLDHRIVEFSAKLPDRYLSGDLGSKQLLRSILFKYVPQALIERPKRGFAAPINKWLRCELKDWASAYLLEDGVASWFDPDLVRKIWDEHQRGRWDWSFQLWGMLMFLDWESKFEQALRPK